jgi:general secretion pathway protein D
MELGVLLALCIIWSQPSVGTAARLATEGKRPTTGASQPQTPEGTPPITDGILLNFKDVDVLQIIDLMSELTGKNFLVDEKVRGKVTVIAPRPVSLDEAYNVFLSILEVQGFTIVPQGPIIKIIPSREVKESPLPTEVDGVVQAGGDRDEFITQLIPLEHADANDIRGLLAALVSKESSLLAYAPTNTLILTEVASNVARLRKIIRALDVEAPASILKVVHLTHASAEQTASSLQAILEGLGESDGTSSQAARPTRRPRRVAQPTPATQRATVAPKMIADSRTNSLVIIATPSDMNTVEDLIAKLDVPTPEGRGQIHVYYLAHAKAEELAQVLTAQSAEIARSTTTANPSQLQEGRTTPQTPTAGRRPGTSPSSTLSGTTPLGITITADKPTNSLVITAPPEAYEAIKGIIEKLDIRRSQVLVEALFAEVTLSSAQALGVEWRVIDDPNGGTQVFGGSTGSTQTGILNTLSNPATLLSGTPTGLIIGALRNTIRIGNTELLNIPAVLRAFQGNTDVNILATPNLLTTDNEEAEIVIGEQRPFLRQATDSPTAGVQGGFSTIRSFEFKDVGITLKLTPQISQGKTVRLNLDIELSAFVSEAEVGAVTTNKRTAKTTVVVDDSQTIVIGGLIREDNNTSQTQVPCLGNLPILGWAFRQQSKDRRKNNLLLFITPHIINTPDDVNRVTEHKQHQSEKSQEIEQQLEQNQPVENLELLLN